MRVEPLERGAGFEFDDKIVGGAIPRQFIPAVEKGILETMQSGGVFGFPVVDVRATCYDGKYHSVDSSEMSFKMAGSLGFKEAMAKATPILLEPISELVVVAPEAYQGDIMGDLNSKRGRIQGIERHRERRGRDRRPGADVRGAALRDRPALDHGWPGPLHAHALALRPGAVAPRRQARHRECPPRDLEPVLRPVLRVRLDVLTEHRAVDPVDLDEAAHRGRGVGAVEEDAPRRS